MSRGDSFGGFSNFKVESFEEIQKDFDVKPITPAFGGSVVDSIYTANRASAWSRWRRGWELATAAYVQDAFEFPFRYSVNLPGVTTSGLVPQIAGVFKGFPSPNKELGMQWACNVLAGSLRFDNIITQVSGQDVRAEIESVTEDDFYWYVQLAGNFSETDPIPPPLFVPVPAGLEGENLQPVKPLLGTVLEDRLLGPLLAPITNETKNPQTGNLYGYVAAVLVDVEADTGVLKLQKQGSLEATPQGDLVTPATRPPHVGRFFINGAVYACTCQDFTQRDYAYFSTLGLRKGYQFPRSSVASLKPGRYEEVKEVGKLMNAAMTDPDVQRDMTIESPDERFFSFYGFNELNQDGPGLSGRDFPGVFRDFGTQFLKSTGNNQNARTEGMPRMKDYNTEEVPFQRNRITQLTDNWSHLLDEYRSCKHIYAMRYEAKLFPPEPSDYPVEVGSMAEWEEDLVMKVQKDQEDAALKYLRYGLSYMDVPPRNIQSPVVIDMMSKVFNLPSFLITIDNFTMFDSTGEAFNTQGTEVSTDVIPPPPNLRPEPEDEPEIGLSFIPTFGDIVDSGFKESEEQKADSKFGKSPILLSGVASIYHVGDVVHLPYSQLSGDSSTMGAYGNAWQIAMQARASGL
jgi:hypothetical protein